jgi:HemK-like putative methylase
VTDLLRQRIAAAAKQLAAAGVPSPQVDAELLAAFVLGVDRGHLVVAEASAGDLARYDDLVDERARRVPLQHLTGRAGFRYLDLAVGPGVFVPRPETEPLAGWAVDEARARRDACVVELCAGAGPIALSVAHEVPDAHVHAVEGDPEAHAWLERNALERSRAGDRPVTVHLMELPDVPDSLLGCVDVVAVNPPYIPVDMVPVDAEVALHDPPRALYGGSDGLEIVRVIVQITPALLCEGGVIAIEHAEGQQRAVIATLRGAGFVDVRGHDDLTGRDRYVTAGKGRA